MDLNLEQILLVKKLLLLSHGENISSENYCNILLQIEKQINN